MTESRCPYCQTPLVARVRPYALRGIYLGRFQFLVCPVEDRVFHPKAASVAIEAIAREKGLFPLSSTVANNDIQPPSVILVPRVKIRLAKEELTRAEGGGKVTRRNQPIPMFEPVVTPTQSTN